MRSPRFTHPIALVLSPFVAVGWACVAALLTMPMASAEPRTATSCWMEGANGEIFDLSALCDSAEPAASEDTDTDDSADADSEEEEPLQVTALAFEDGLMTGTVANTSETTARFVQVRYEVRNAAGEVVDQGVTYTEPSTIAPGGTSTFRRLVRVVGEGNTAEVIAIEQS